MDDINDELNGIEAQSFSYATALLSLESRLGFRLVLNALGQVSSLDQGLQALRTDAWNYWRWVQEQDAHRRRFELLREFDNWKALEDHRRWKERHPIRTRLIGRILRGAR